MACFGQSALPDRFCVFLRLQQMFFLFVVFWHQSEKERDTLNDTLIITHIFKGCPTAAAVSFHQARPRVLIKTFPGSPERGSDGRLLCPLDALLPSLKRLFPRGGAGGGGGGERESFSPACNLFPPSSFGVTHLLSYLLIQKGPREVERPLYLQPKEGGGESRGNYAQANAFELKRACKHLN